MDKIPFWPALAPVVRLPHSRHDDQSLFLHPHRHHFQGCGHRTRHIHPGHHGLQHFRAHTHPNHFAPVHQHRIYHLQSCHLHSHRLALVRCLHIPGLHLAPVALDFEYLDLRSYQTE